MAKSCRCEPNSLIFGLEVGMSYVIAAPEMMTSAATDLATIGSDLSVAHTAAAASTVRLIPAAADEVSATVAHLFSNYAEDYHVLAGKAAAFHEQFVGHLTAGAGAYTSAEAANAAQVAPWQQSLFNLSSKLAAVLGRSPVTTPVPSDPDLLSKTTIFGTIYADPDDNYFDSISWSIGGGPVAPPLVTDTLTSGFEPTLGLGAPGQTINTLECPEWQAVRQGFYENDLASYNHGFVGFNGAGPPTPPVFHPLINSLPVTDPLARLFWALLPLGF
jgi:hypothetical protein